MKKLILLTTTLFAACVLHAQWSLTGNTGTVPPANYLGTNDLQHLVIKTNATTRFTLNYNGNLTLETPQSIGLPDGNKEGTINISQQWGDWMQLRRSAGTGYWGIHNPQNQDALTFYFKNDLGAYNFNIFELYSDGKIRMGDVPITGNYRLYVDKGILTEKVKVAIKTTGDWSDHVFNEAYPLMPLDRLQDYIQEHKHLPNIPSAEEVVQKGIDLGEMNSKLLGKIEELTLYIIDLKKENDNIKKQLEEILATKHAVQK